MYRSERLPHDAFALVPLPLPVGGALVVCSNMVLHVNQGFSCGLALNEFGDKQVRVFSCMHVFMFVCEFIIIRGCACECVSIFVTC